MANNNDLTETSSQNGRDDCAYHLAHLIEKSSWEYERLLIYPERRQVSLYAECGIRDISQNLFETRRLEHWLMFVVCVCLNNCSWHYTIQCDGDQSFVGYTKVFMISNLLEFSVRLECGNWMIMAQNIEYHEQPCITALLKSRLVQKEYTQNRLGSKRWLVAPLPAEELRTR